nr:metallothionein 3 [Sedum alfredii]
MSSSCGSCNCADKSQCGKNGWIFAVDEQISEDIFTVMDAPVAENHGKCKCGSSCSCTTCTCGH